MSGPSSYRILVERRFPKHDTSLWVTVQELSDESEALRCGELYARGVIPDGVVLPKLVTLPTGQPLNVAINRGDKVWKRIPKQAAS